MEASPAFRTKAMSNIKLIPLIGVALTLPAGAAYAQSQPTPPPAASPQSPQPTPQQPLSLIHI